MKGFGAFAFAAAVLVVTCAANVVPVENKIHDANIETDYSVRGFLKCADAGGFSGIVNCAAIRALKSLQSVSRKPVLEIVPGITLDSDENVERSPKEVNEIDLPENPEEKATKLYDLLWEQVDKFISGRSIKIKIPEKSIENMSRALEEEGRKRKRKGSKFPSIMLGMGAKMMAIVPAVLAGLALLSTKALIIAKLALALAAIVFFQSFLSKGSSLLSGLGGGGHTLGTSYGTNFGGGYSPSTWTTNTLGGPYARSIDVAAEKAAAQDYAYAGSRPQ